MKKVLSCILSFLPAISFVIAITGLICFSVFVSEPLNAEKKMISFIMMLFAFPVFWFVYIRKE